MSQQALDFNPASPESRLANVYSLPNRPRDRDRVLHALCDAGERGLSDFELSDVLSAAGPRIQATSCGKRRLDLVRDGFVVRRLVVDPATLELVPDRRPSPTGALASVWHLARFGRPQ